MAEKALCCIRQSYTEIDILWYHLYWWTLLTCGLNHEGESVSLQLSPMRPWNRTGWPLEGNSEQFKNLIIDNYSILRQRSIKWKKNQIILYNNHISLNKTIRIDIWLSCLQLFVKLEEPDHHHRTTQKEHSVYLNQVTIVQFGKQIITCITIKENIEVEISLQHDNFQTTNSVVSKC